MRVGGVGTPYLLSSSTSNSTIDDAHVIVENFRRTENANEF